MMMNQTTNGNMANSTLEAGCHPTQTLRGISRLAFPDLMVVIEATAMK
jgi:hypothetical protein